MAGLRENIVKDAQSRIINERIEVKMIAGHGKY